MLTLDESKENDEVVTVKEVCYVVDVYLLERCGGIIVDFVEEDNWSGFAIVSTNPLLGRC